MANNRQEIDRLQACHRLNEARKKYILQCMWDCTLSNAEGVRAYKVCESRRIEIAEKIMQLC
jgi:hypothetical protein